MRPSARNRRICPEIPSGPLAPMYIAPSGPNRSVPSGAPSSEPPSPSPESRAPSPEHLVRHHDRGLAEPAAQLTEARDEQPRAVPRRLRAQDVEQAGAGELRSECDRQCLRPQVSRSEHRLDWCAIGRPGIRVDDAKCSAPLRHEGAPPLVYGHVHGIDEVSGQDVGVKLAARQTRRACPRSTRRPPLAQRRRTPSAAAAAIAGSRPRR